LSSCASGERSRSGIDKQFIHPRWTIVALGLPSMKHENSAAPQYILR
jgi:hypothetical protein